MEKDVGVWITYVDENDDVHNIDYPIGWSTGNTDLQQIKPTTSGVDTHTTLLRGSFIVNSDVSKSL